MREIDESDNPRDLDGFEELLPLTPVETAVVEHCVVEDEAEQRLDHWLTAQFPGHSRSQWQKAILSGDVRVNGEQVKPSHRLRPREQITGRLEPTVAPVLAPAPIALEILYQDEHLVVVNKPAHLIVHPGKANYGGTLANALVHHFATLSETGGAHRPGIVHRLDRDTTGVIVIALDNPTHEHLSAQFAERNVEKEYRAIVWGRVEFDADWIETWIRPHSKHREKMVVCGPDPEARQANTFYEVLRRYRGFTYLKLLPKTGRTHQLRVHLQYLRHPIVADRLYGGHPQLTLAEVLASKEHFSEDRVLIQRQALHAYRLRFTHPATGKSLEFVAPLPEDMQQTLAALEEHAR
ncbi:MAG: RluA family pseudouridine synthase [Planctomycetaceae bacterium]|nr:RluA family pseudouridine synthase [Planctomycetaceae bacterium]